jgi:hypothetical protein
MELEALRCGKSVRIEIAGVITHVLPASLLVVIDFLRDAHAKSRDRPRVVALLPSAVHGVTGGVVITEVSALTRNRQRPEAWTGRP